MASVGNISAPFVEDELVELGVATIVAIANVPF